jgi:ATP-dependent Clp protease protease subunit
MKKKHQSDQDGAIQKPATPPSTSTSRDVFVFGRLENEVALPTIKRLLKLNERDPKLPINLYINSSGGNGYNADGIIAVMHAITAKVNTICLGHALSGACEILASGTGERSAYEFSTLMFHQTLWEAEGDITNLEIQAVQGRRFREAQIELLHRSSGQSKERLRKDIERDFYLSTKEALEYGLIDKIMVHTATRHLSPSANGKKNQSSVPVAHAAKKPAALHKKLK